LRASVGENRVCADRKKQGELATSEEEENHQEEKQQPAQPSPAALGLLLLKGLNW